jgi:hypothetical protein
MRPLQRAGAQRLSAWVKFDVCIHRSRWPLSDRDLPYQPGLSVLGRHAQQFPEERLLTAPLSQYCTDNGLSAQLLGDHPRYTPNKASACKSINHRKHLRPINIMGKLGIDKSRAQAEVVNR